MDRQIGCKNLEPYILYHSYRVSEYTKVVGPYAFFEWAPTPLCLVVHRTSGQSAHDTMSNKGGSANKYTELTQS